MRLARLFPLVVAVLTAGCFAPVESSEDVAETADALAPSGADAARILDLVNYPGTDVETLDIAVGLDVRAAKKIIAHRDGADGKPLTADDNLFNDIAELDGISYVSESAFSKLATYAAAHPAPSAETVESVLFRGWESEAVSWGLNHATVAELDNEVGLDARAAKALHKALRLANVTAAGKVSYVGVAALKKLRAHAGAWWNEMNGETEQVCGAELASDVAPLIDGLWYISESDYPFTVVSKSSAHTGAITPAELAGLVGVPAGTVSEVRTLDKFFTPYFLTQEDGARYTALRDLLQSELTDVTVIRFGEIQIGVYIVGRTACGEVFGVMTTAIET